MDYKESKLGSSFGWLNATQFLGALNDNIFKLLLIAFLIGLGGSAAASNVSAVALAVFVVPFLLFLALAGRLADRFSKRDIIVAVKIAEVLVMVAGCAAFMLKSELVLYGVLFMMAAQSAFFSPSKYGIVPELVRTEQLSRANGYLKAFTYLAIVIGTASVPLLLYVTGERYGLVGLMCSAIAAMGLVASLSIRHTPAAGGKKKASFFFVRDIWRTLLSIHRDRDLLLAVIGAAYFLLIAAFILINVIPYGMESLGFDQTQGGYLFAPAAIGIGLGALLAGKLSWRNIEFGIIPVGALGLTFTSAGLGFMRVTLYHAFALIFLMGISAGLFIVPIHAFIQLRSPRTNRGEILAASSFLGWVGVLLASGLIYACSGLWGMSAAQVFVVLGGMALALSAVSIVLLPDFLVRLLALLIVRLCCRIKVSGIENIPPHEGVLLICNHASWVDPLLLNATQQRRIRFIMYRRFYNNFWLKPICRLMGVIPVSAKDPPKKLIASLNRARSSMDAGFIVCMFAEGAMTRNGMLRAFKSGFERIMRGSCYKIVPGYLGGTWGSIFSYYYGKPLSTLLKRFPYPVSIHFGEPMPSESSADQIRQKVSELSCEYFESLKPRRRSLADHFVQVARKNWRRRCISDSTGKQLNYGRTLVSTLVLACQLEKLTQGQEKIGILLPPSVGSALVNLAVTMLGKVAVNLNYVVSEQAINSTVSQCGIKCVISSRSFVEKIKIGNLNTLPGLFFLEDITAKLEYGAKIRAYLKARFTPRRILTKARRFCADDLATIIFSSGSSSEPKGVMLSHHNILSNIEAQRMVFRLNPEDNLCAVLPFFHSFGFTCALWLPLVSGVSASYVANPINGRLVGKSAHENKSTILFAAPTFLLNYIRSAEHRDFVSLRAVIVGAEKLKKRIADSFEEKFGIRPLEGYGATELSPVVSLNLPNVQGKMGYQLANKPGTVGHPIPGVAVRIVDVHDSYRDSLRRAEVPLGEPGLLMVKGPNVMLGYLNKQKETSEVLKDGWYDTGDIASVDEDGFLTIADRLSRFSKIGGEMFGHLALEEVCMRALDTHEQVVAVTSVPEPKKGEQLVVLYLEEAADADKLHEIVSKSHLPNICKPRRENFIKIESIPLLGSGKLDIRRLRKIALKAKGL